MVLIGIDPGVKTGFAVWDDSKQEFLEIQTLQIHNALERVVQLNAEFKNHIAVYFEDARQRTYIPQGRERVQGAGSIKRDCKIWEDFCKDFGIEYFAIPPGRGMTKWTADYFKLVTGWKGHTSNHARDAAVLVYNRKHGR